MKNKMNRIKNSAVAILAALVIVGAFGAEAHGMEAYAETVKENRVAIPAEQMIGSIKAAVGAKPGQVMEAETEKEGGRVICDVKVYTDDGKTYSVKVYAATGKVLQVDPEDVE